MLTWTPSGDGHMPRFDGRSAADWLTQAERFGRMAEQFAKNPQLSESFRDLAAGTRQMARKMAD